MVSKDDINRLGFDAWADNKFVDLIENYVDASGSGGTGEISITHKDYDIRIDWTQEEVNCTIRAYTSDGWQTYSKTTRR